MRCGVDIDGTVTAMPEVFLALTRALMREGHRVYVITSGLPDHPAHDTPAGRQRQLERVGFRLGIHYDRLLIARGSDRAEVARAKADLCHGLGLDVMFDNDPVYVAAERQVTNVMVPTPLGG